MQSQNGVFTMKLNGRETSTIIVQIIMLAKISSLLIDWRSLLISKTSKYSSKNKPKRLTNSSGRVSKTSLGKIEAAWIFVELEIKRVTKVKSNRKYQTLLRVIANTKDVETMMVCEKREDVLSESK